MKKSLLFPLMLLAIVTFYAGSTVAATQSADKKIVSMKQHEKEGVKCVDCHGVDNPEKMASYQNCISCHENSDGTYRGDLDKNGVGIEKEYPESRKTKMAAMHDSHVGKLRCTLCHTSHKAPDNAKIYCNYCHQFEVKIK